MGSTRSVLLFVRAPRDPRTRHYAGRMHLLPKPGSVVRSEESPFVLDDDLAINGSPQQAAIIRRLLSPGTGLDLPAPPTAG